MPLANGVFTRLYNWVTERDAGSPRNKIYAEKFDQQEEDIGTAIETALMRDGQNTAAADIPMGGFKFTSVGAAALRSQFARATEVQDGVIFKAASPGGTIDAMTGTLAPAITAYVAGMIVSIVAPGSASNTVTTPTLQLNGIASPKTIRKHAGALAVGDYTAGDQLLLVYDGTGFELLNPRGVSASGNTVVNNGSGSLEVALLRNAQVGTTYTMLTGDRGKHVTFSNGSAIAVTLPQAGSAGFLLGWHAIVENLGAGAATITPTTSTINGAATLVLTFGAAQAYLITSDGTNYRALPMYSIPASAIDLNGLTTDATGGATGDFVPFVDVSDANASNKVTVADLFYNAITNATADAAPDMAADHLVTRDDSASAYKKVLLQYIGAGLQTVWVPAGAMVSRTTLGPSAGTTESTTNKVMSKTFDFDQTNNEFAQFTVAFPKSWDLGTVTAQFFWKSTATGNAIFGLQGAAISDDDLTDTAFGTAQEVTDGVTATTDLMVSGATAAITIGGTPAAGDLVVFQVYRNAASASDTIAADVLLVGVKLFYTTTVNTDL